MHADCRASPTGRRCTASPPLSFTATPPPLPSHSQGEPDETKLHGVSYVEEATRWGAEKPAQIPDNIYREHRSRGFKVVTEDREFMLYSDSEAITAKCVALRVLTTASLRTASLRMPLDCLLIAS